MTWLLDTNTLVYILNGESTGRSFLPDFARA